MCTKICNCYSNDIKSKCQKCVLVISIILFLQGVITIAFGLVAREDYPASGM